MRVVVPVTSSVFVSAWTEASEASSFCGAAAGVTAGDDADRDSSKLLKLEDTAGTDATEREKKYQTHNVNTLEVS